MGGGISLHASWLEAFVYSDDTRTEITNITEAGFYATRLEIPDTVTRVSYLETSAVSLTIPASVTSIGNYAFEYCYRLVEVYNLSSLDITIGSEDNGMIGFYAKVIHTSLEEKSNIVESNGVVYYVSGDEKIAVTPVDMNATTVTLDSDCTIIWNYAFNYCSSLTSITIPASVTSIGGGAFEYCYRLVEVYNLSSLSITAGSSSNGYVGYYAKVIHTSLEEKSNIVESNGVVYYKYNSEKIAVTPVDMNATTVTLDSDCTIIWNYAFFRCSSLTSITIPANVTSIGHMAFNRCYRLVEVYNLSSLDITAGSTGNEYVGCYAKVVYTSLEEESNLVESNGVIYYVDGDEKIAVKPVDMNATSVTLVSGCTSINKFAFYYCENLTSITIPSGVTSIGSYAFNNCSKLSTVTFEEGSQCTSIGSDAFCECSSLTSITIPASVTSIGGWAFEKCSKLETVTFEEGSQLTSIESSAFNGCSNLTSVYYSGSADEWSSISIGSSNTSLTNATRYYYSKTEPTDTTNNYWHYDADGNIVVWTKSTT